MGVFASQFVDAWDRFVARGRHDPCAAQKGLRRCGSRRHVASLIFLLIWPVSGLAETIRIATFAAPFSRDGPGLLLRDLRKNEDAQLTAAMGIIAHTSPDILLLTDFDYDYDAVALSTFAQMLGYPHHFALRPNTGLQTNLDLDGNGRLGEARDAQGYGRFAGDGGMAIVSRFPINAETVADYSAILWKDLPGATLPAMITDAVAGVQRLSTSGHWVVPVNTDSGPLTLLAYAATPPVFDGPEDRNGLRNRDELLLWENLLDDDPPDGFVLLGNANLDPAKGQGYSTAMAAFLSRPILQDPHPNQPTAHWADDGPGKLRVSYVLPARDWTVTDAGVFWPAPDEPDVGLLGSDGLVAGVHHLVWVDLRRDP